MKKHINVKTIDGREHNFTETNNTEIRWDFSDTFGNEQVLSVIVTKTVTEDSPGIQMLAPSARAEHIGTFKTHYVFPYRNITCFDICKDLLFVHSVLQRNE